LDKTIHNQKVNYLYSGLDGFVSTVAQIVLFVAGGLQVLNGNFTIGMFTIFSSYFGMMLGASRYFFSIGAAYQNTLAAYDRITEIFAQPVETNGTMVIDDISRIELHNVGFSYGDKNVVRGFNATFEKGKLYGISGANGAGKSTIISLILGMYVDEFSGRISYNGVDIREIDMTHARRNLIGFAEQEPVLVEELDEQNANAFGNSGLSGGEKQKIAIQKALAKNPAVLILDEPTSALDNEAARRLVEQLQELKQDRIVIVITHDEFFKQECDVVVRL